MLLEWEERQRALAYDPQPNERLTILQPPRRSSLPIAFGIAMLFFGRAAAAQDTPPVRLSISSATAAPGGDALIEISLDPMGQEITALSLSVEFDPSSLSVDGSGGSGKVASVDLAIPPRLASSSYYFPEEGRLGISIYNQRLPLADLPAGVLARIRFSVKPSASGFAYVRPGRDPSPEAVDESGRLLPLTILTSSSGVTVTASHPSVHPLPASLAFGSVPVSTRVRRTLVLRNMGSGPAVIRQIELASSGSPFALEPGPLPMTLAAGASTSVGVVFESDSSGTSDNYLVLNVENAPDLLVPLTATAVAPGTYLYGTSYLIPVVARVAGAYGSRWVSDLVVFNGAGFPASFRLRLVEPGGRASTSETVELSPEQTMHFDDVIQRFFGEIETSGYLLVEASSPQVIAGSSAFNLTAEGGRIGQSVPIVDSDSLGHTGQMRHLIGIEVSDRVRTNIGLINLSDHPATIHARLFTSDGAVIGSRDYTLSATDLVHSIDLFNVLGIDQGSGLSVELTTDTPDTGYFAYASIVDDQSGSAVLRPLNQ